MENINKFFMNDKSYRLPVVASINLTEEQPDKALLHEVAQMEVKKEKGVFVKRVAGTLFLIVAIIQFIGIIMLAFQGYYKGLWDYRLIIHLIVLMVFGTLASVLFQRKKAKSPDTAFWKYWESYFKFPDFGTKNIKPLTSFRDLFCPPAQSVANLQSFYPVSIEIKEEEIIQFAASMTEIIEKHFTELTIDKGNKDKEFIYGVNYHNEDNNYSISEINETLVLVNCGIHILKFYFQGKEIEGNCIRLNVYMYIAKSGEYWAPVNHVPKFKELKKEEQKTVHHSISEKMQETSPSVPKSQPPTVVPSSLERQDP